MKLRTQLLYLAAFLLAASPLEAPQLLAFPYAAQLGPHRVYSEQRITSAVRTIVAKADALAAGSPIANTSAHQPIFLTSGDWRWTWLAANSRGAFALSRPGTEVIVINRSDPAADTVYNSSSVAGKRTLSGTIAHEMTHGAIRNRFGVTADLRYPAWLREGYSDYVAGGGSLSDAQARKLIAAHQYIPALTYWQGRKRIETDLQRNGGSVDALFATAR